MARGRSDDIPETLVHLTSVATSVAVATGTGVPEHEVRQKLRDADVYEDWEGSPAVLRSTARRVRAELIAELDARRLSAIEANARNDRERRQAERERAEAGRRQRERAIFGTRVSAPGATPEPWMDLPSSGDE
jgi:hypothetical protein